MIDDVTRSRHTPKAAGILPRGCGGPKFPPPWRPGSQPWPVRVPRRPGRAGPAEVALCAGSAAERLRLYHLFARACECSQPREAVIWPVNDCSSFAVTARHFLPCTVTRLQLLTYPQQREDRYSTFEPTTGPCPMAAISDDLKIMCDHTLIIFSDPICEILNWI